MEAELNNTIITEARCETCKFVRGVPNGGMECRAEPPKAELAGIGPQGPWATAFWPPVRPEGWCGRWTARLAS